ncbi:MAG: DUF3486 family protein [Hyphomicrobiaceae bacterium]|nr:DUF3486 family protein [Hyphomicrobiaceae bacterium]
MASRSRATRSKQKAERRGKSAPKRKPVAAPAAGDDAERKTIKAAAGERPRRKGRGRLSSIDILPEDAEPAVQRAFAALKDRKHPQAQILRVLNMELEALGAKPISKSAFNRKALWLASYGRQLEQAREIASVWAERLDETPDGDVGLLLGETLKTLIFDVLTETTLSAQSPSMVMLGVASEALRNLEKARELSVTTRVKIERDFIKDAKKAVDRVAKEKGLSKDTISAIKSQILGVRAAA